MSHSGMQSGIDGEQDRGRGGEWGRTGWGSERGLQDCVNDKRWRNQFWTKWERLIWEWNKENSGKGSCGRKEGMGRRENWKEEGKRDITYRWLEVTDCQNCKRGLNLLFMCRYLMCQSRQSSEALPRLFLPLFMWFSLVSLDFIDCGHINLKREAYPSLINSIINNLYIFLSRSTVHFLSYLLTQRRIIFPQWLFRQIWKSRVHWEAVLTLLLLAELLDRVGSFIFILFDTACPCLIFNFLNCRNLAEAIKGIALTIPDGSSLSWWICKYIH